MSRAMRVAIVIFSGWFIATWAAEAAWAQQPNAPRKIGIVLPGFDAASDAVKAFRQGLRQAGYVEGRDVIIEWRHGAGAYDRVPEQIADLVRRRVDVLVVESTVAALAAKRATTTIPVVMAFVADPVGSGVVQSLAHPGGNITGMSLMMVDLTVKRLQLLKEAVPHARRIAVLWNPQTPFHRTVIDDLEAAAPGFGVTLKLFGAATADQLQTALLELSRAEADSLLVLGDPLSGTHQTTILRMASRAGVPVAWGATPASHDGVLMSYAPDTLDLFRRAAGYVDQDPQGRQALATSRRAADHVRAGCQSENSQSPRADHSRVDHDSRY